jgi:hypothetical protein
VPRIDDWNPLFPANDKANGRARNRAGRKPDQTTNASAECAEQVRPVAAANIVPDPVPDDSTNGCGPDDSRSRLAETPLKLGRLHPKTLSALSRTLNS